MFRYHKNDYNQSDYKKRDSNYFKTKMERWIDIIGSEPIEPEIKPITLDKSIKCCNCGGIVNVTEKWSKCEGCKYYCCEK